MTWRRASHAGKGLLARPSYPFGTGSDFP